MAMEDPDRTASSRGRPQRSRISERSDRPARRPRSSGPGDLRRPAAQGLAALRDEMGYETASLFVPARSGWELIERQGPERPWHAVLDPGALQGTPEIAEYEDARTIPGLGPRLAAMGCASLATLPLPHGGQILLDSSSRTSSTRWIERAAPYVGLAGLLSGPQWGVGSPLGNAGEVAALERMFEACQELVGRAEAAVEELLSRVREAIHADELFLLAAEGGKLLVLRSPVEDGPKAIRWGNEALGAEGSALGRETLARLAIALGMSSRAVAGAVARPGGRPELILAGWASGPALSPVSMTVVARAVSTARKALEERGHAVSAIVGKERERMAYALHDDLTQTVTGAVLELEALRTRIERDPQDAIRGLDTSKAEIRRALGDLRGMLFDLQRSAEEQGHQASAEPLARYVDDVVRRWRLPARVVVEGDLRSVPARVMPVAYVVVREALANAAKHASGRGVDVVLSAAAGELSVTVSDAGPGFTRAQQEAALTEHHFGLEMLRRRVGEVGGLLVIDSEPGRGTRVTARIPLAGAGP